MYDWLIPEMATSKRRKDSGLCVWGIAVRVCVIADVEARGDVSVTAGVCVMKAGRIAWRR